jgi:electron transfer flavoprotein beta subunit
MKIVVCIKQVPNTNKVKLDPATGTLLRKGIPSIINPDDKAGLEAALRLKDRHGAQITALSMGPPQAEAALREALAMGADEAVLLTNRAFGGADTWATSSTLAAALKRLEHDLILTGRQAIDGDTAQVGPQIAEHLGLPNISYAEELRLEGDHIVVKRQYEDRYHVIKAKLPCLVTALAELNKPRYMTPGGIFAAYAKPIRVWGRSDLDVDDADIGLNGSPTRVFKSFDKQARGAGSKVEMDPQAAAAWLVERLQEKFIL